MKNKISVLGQGYEILFHTSEDDPKLKEWNGYHEPYSKKIVIDSKLVEDTNKEPLGAENPEIYLRHIYRHEIMHAFFCESGITYRYDKEEEDFLVDWIARMYPKMKKIFAELGVED